MKHDLCACALDGVGAECGGSSDAYYSFRYGFGKYGMFNVELALILVDLQSQSSQYWPTSGVALYKNYEVRRKDRALEVRSGSKQGIEERALPLAEVTPVCDVIGAACL